jgi:capsular exopolysaccharide synthesis family protein
MSTHTSPRSQDAFTSHQIDFRAFYYTLRERTWVIGLCLLIAACGTVAYLLRAPKVYAGKVLLQIEQKQQNVLKIENVVQDTPQNLESLKTIEETLVNRALLARVIAANKLMEDPRFISAEASAPPTEAAAVSKLARMLDVKLRKGTRLIDVRVEHTDPKLAAALANSLVTEYIRQNSELSATASEIANEFLVKEADELKVRLEQSENALQAYKESTQSASFEDQQNVVVQKLKELTARVTEAKSARIQHETAYNQSLQLGNDPEALLIIPGVANDVTVVEIRGKLAQQESDIANIRQRYREKHPKYIQALSQWAEWRKGLDRAIINASHSLESAYRGAQTSEAALESAFREQEKAALALNKQSIRYNVLAREVESDRALYQAVLNRIKETSVTKDMNPNVIRIVQPAVTPERPAKPDVLKISLLGVFAGIASGIMLAMFLNALDRSIKTVDQAEECLQLPVLSTVPKFSGVPEDQRKLIMSDEAQSAEAESFRTLRTALSMLGRKEDRRTFLFTSAVPEEGKSFCSLNFSVSLAQQGLRTLIIDCDLRRPTVEKSLCNTNRRAVGLTDYLTGQKSFQDIVHSTDVDNFFYIPAGSHAPNPAELLAKTGIDGLMNEALAHFDRVVVDSAPIHAVSDTLLVLSRIQTVCLVTRVRRTPRNAVMRAVQILREANAPLAGVILNLMPRMGRAGYYYDSYYEYSYRGYYHEKPVAA